MSNLKQSMMAPAAWEEVQALQNENEILRKDIGQVVYVITENWDDNSSTTICGTIEAALACFHEFAKENGAEVVESWNGNWAYAGREVSDDDNYSVFVEQTEVKY